MMFTLCFDVSLVRPSMVLLFLHKGIDGRQLRMMGWLGR